MKLLAQREYENIKEFIYRTLKYNIMTLFLKPGEKISESELQNFFNTSKSPIREALVKLKEEKLIEAIPQKGTFISKINLKLVENTLFIRKILEKEVLRLVILSPLDKKVLIEKLNDEKQSLENAKVEMEVAKQELLNKQDDLEATKASKQIIIDEQERQAAELEALGDTISANIDSIKSAISKIDLNGVVAAEGWTNPVPGAYRSAGTWNYSGGGKHLGYDFAASQGTNIYAVANGVVVNSADGCAYGGLVSTCHGSGGSSGGGNQVYLVVAVGDTLYAVKYLHMQNGSPIATGTKVTGGDYIGRVGSTGNSSGPHCHIEIFKIGAASDFASYVKNWNGDLTFGCGWAGSYDGYGRRCEAGYGIPCRIRPESVFGG